MYNHKPPPDNVQTKRTVTLFTFFMELCPFEIFRMKIMTAILLLFCQEYFHETLYNYKPPSDDGQRKRTVIPHTFLLNYAPLNIFLRKVCPLYNFNSVKNTFLKLCTNINHYQTMCREKEMIIPATVFAPFTAPCA